MANDSHFNEVTGIAAPKPIATPVPLENRSTFFNRAVVGFSGAKQALSVVTQGPVKEQVTKAISTIREETGDRSPSAVAGNLMAKITAVVSAVEAISKELGATIHVVDILKRDGELSGASCEKPDLMKNGWVEISGTKIPLGYLVRHLFFMTQSLCFVDDSFPTTSVNSILTNLTAAVGTHKYRKGIHLIYSPQLLTTAGLKVNVKDLMIFQLAMSTDQAPIPYQKPITLSTSTPILTVGSGGTSTSVTPVIDADGYLDAATKAALAGACNMIVVPVRRVNPMFIPTLRSLFGLFASKKMTEMWPGLELAAPTIINKISEFAGLSDPGTSLATKDTDVDPLGL